MQPLKWKINRWLMLENIFLVYGDHLVWFSKAKVHGMLTGRIHLCCSPAIRVFCELRARGAGVNGPTKRLNIRFRKIVKKSKF